MADADKINLALNIILLILLLTLLVLIICLIISTFNTSSPYNQDGYFYLPNEATNRLGTSRVNVRCRYTYCKLTDVTSQQTIIAIVRDFLYVNEANPDTLTWAQVTERASKNIYETTQVNGCSLQITLLNEENETYVGTKGYVQALVPIN